MFRNKRKWDIKNYIVRVGVIGEIHDSTGTEDKIIKLAIFPDPEAISQYKMLKIVTNIYTNGFKIICSN